MSAYPSDLDADTTAEPRTAAPEKPVTCSYAECQHRFDTEEDMIDHKIIEPTHFYCKKCNVDCVDWYDLLKHQVDSMAPFLGEKKRAEGERPKHIVCEICGINFKAMDGRKRHRRQAHPADQDVKCAGCHCKFPRASHMIDHLESGRCHYIARTEFYAHMQHKYILAQVMKAPGPFQDAIRNNQQQILPAMDGLSIESDGAEEGGVSLLEEVNEAQQSGYKPLQPERKLMMTQSHCAKETWPRLPSAAAESMSRANSQAETQSGTSSAWTGWTGRASKALFKVESADQPAAGQWNAIVEYAQEQSESTNLLKTHFWTDEQIFFNGFLQCYICPFPACQNDQQPYETLGEIQQHVQLAHLRNFYRCDSCFKRFGTCAALVGHVESTFKCPVKNSYGFKKFIDEITGGFLKVERVSEPKIYGRDLSMVKHGEQPFNGITSTKYTGKCPDE